MTEFVSEWFAANPRIADKIDPSDGCWEWTAFKNNKGYGRIVKEGKVRFAHRVICEAINGPIPTGYEVDHLCRNTGCVRPDHLEAVTPEENRRRRLEHTVRKTHCPHGHAYDETNTYWINKPGGRLKQQSCRICHASAVIRHRERGRRDRAS